MDEGTQKLLGWAHIVLGVLVVLNQWLAWAGGLQYLWGVLVLLGGIWVLVAK